MKRHTKYNPQPGERYGKLVRRGKIEVVNSRTILKRDGDTIVFTPRRQRQTTTTKEWRKWVQDAHLCNA